MIDYITAASLVIGLGGLLGGFVLGRLTSGINAVRLKEQAQSWQRAYVKAETRIREQGRQIAAYRAADHARKAKARLRDDRYRARQAEKRAARYAKTHAELAGIVAEKAA